jgi:hypothetical protein
MCNEIIRNYTKKEDQLMTAAFGTREKRRLNRVMDALNFEYSDYERLDEGPRGGKKKRAVSIMKRQAIRSIKEDQRAGKKQKNSQGAEGFDSQETKACQDLPRRRYKMYQKRLPILLRLPLSVFQKY